MNTKLKKLHSEWKNLNRLHHYVNGVEFKGTTPDAREGAEWVTVRAGRAIARKAEWRVNDGHCSSLDGSWSNGVGGRWIWGDPKRSEKYRSESMERRAEEVRQALCKAEDALSDEEYEAWSKIKHQG